MTQAHPTAADLRDFLLGKLDDGSSDSVEAHLADCPACAERAATEPATDTLVELLVGAATRVNAPPLPPDTPCAEAFTRTHAGPPLPAPVNPLAPPAELADHPKYRVLRALGVGGMGTVWLAEHLVMGRQVAVKVIRAEWANRPGAAERFHREVRAAAKLSHPNIALAFDAEPFGDRHLLAMEYVPGETLADLVRRGPRPAAEACRAVRDAALGLAHAHAAGLVHRDIKPGNLIRTPDGVTKVLDFGLVSAGPDGAALTGGNVVMGTPDYIAPEQAVDARAADARSDVYSLGCTLYHLLSGRVPYPEGSTLAKIDAHRDPARHPAPLDVPPALAGVVARMTATSPADRYQTAAEVAAVLEPFVRDAECGARGAERKRRKAIPRWAVAAGVLFALATVAAGVVYKIQRDNEVITIATDDPDVDVVMKRNGELVRIVDTKTKQAWELDTRKMRLKPDGSELTLDLPDKGPLVIRRNGGVAVSIERMGKGVPPAKPAQPDTLRPYRMLVGHTAYPWHVVFSSDAKTVYSCGADKYVRIWDVETGRETAKCRQDNMVLRLALAEGGKTLLSISAPEKPDQPTSRLYAWDAVTGQEAKVFPALPKAEGHLTCLAVSPDGKRAATLTMTGVIRVWDVASRKTERTWKTGFADRDNYGIVWSPDGALLAVAGDTPLTVWEAATGKRVHAGDKVHGDTSAVFSADGKYLFVAGWSGVTRKYDCSTWKQEQPLRTNESRGPAASHLAVLNADRLVITAHTADVRIWDVWADKLALRLHDDGLDSATPAVSADGQWVACGSGDGKIRVWKLPDSMVGPKK